MTGGQSALELCDDPHEQAVAANGGRGPAVDVDLGSTTKLSVVAHQPATGAAVVVGSVFSPASAEKLRQDVIAAGFTDVQIVPEYSARDFRIAAGQKP